MRPTMDSKDDGEGRRQARCMLGDHTEGIMSRAPLTGVALPGVFPLRDSYLSAAVLGLLLLLPTPAACEGSWCGCKCRIWAPWKPWPRRKVRNQSP